MNEMTYGSAGAVTGDRTRALFGQTMGYVAITAGFFALGAYLGRHLSEGWAFAWFIIAFGCLIGMKFTARRAGSVPMSTALLLVVGATLGLAMAPSWSGTRTPAPRRCGRPAAPLRCSLPASARPATRPGGTCPGWPG
jgi:hypothetical protein